ncbi:MAG: class I tRNA ligase family protein, partial [Verrucomicrobiota bacterium]
PFMPHITEELWLNMGFAKDGRPLMKQALPSESVMAGIDPNKATESPQQAQAIYQATSRMRNLKAEYNLATNKELQFVIKTDAPWLANELPTLKRLVGAAGITLDADYQPPKSAAGAVTDLGEVYLPLEGLIDVEAEKSRLTKELKKVSGELDKVTAKLSNSNFVDRAPREIIDEHKLRQDDWRLQREKITGMLANLDEAG